MCSVGFCFGCNTRIAVFCDLLECVSKESLSVRHKNSVVHSVNETTVVGCVMCVCVHACVCIQNAFCRI